MTKSRPVSIQRENQTVRRKHSHPPDRIWPIVPSGRADQPIGGADVDCFTL